MGMFKTVTNYLVQKGANGNPRLKLGHVPKTLKVANYVDF